VAGALFLLGAVLALLNLGRDKKGVHLLIILFGLGACPDIRRSISTTQTQDTYSAIVLAITGSTTKLFSKSVDCWLTAGDRAVFVCPQ